MKELFLEKHPQLVREIHPDKNTGIDFTILYENSSTEVVWQCQNNSKHIWKQKIGVRATKGYGCPYCSGRLTLPEESFASLYPNIAKELHPDKNKNLNPYEHRPGSNKIVWWKCKNGHEWQQAIRNRTLRKSPCRECRKLSNSLEIKHPEIAKEWHFEKNAPLKPSEVGPRSNKKVWWKCKTDSSHEWQVSIVTRTTTKSSCPKCRSKKTGAKKALPVLSDYSPQLSSEWHPQKNGELKPTDVTAGSSLKVWWQCSNDPTHEWAAVISERARKGKGCPKCARRSKCNPSNSLSKKFPEIAKQWHPTKNHMGPSDVSYGSSYYAWWLCLKDPSHEWQAKVVTRTQRNRIECPKCPESRTSVENSLAIVHPSVAAQWHPTKNGQLTPYDVSRASGQKVWWRCLKNPDHEWEAQIKNRTVLGSGCPDCFQELNAIRLTEHLYDLTSSDIDAYHILLSNLGLLKKLLDLEIKGHKRIGQPYLRMLYSSAITYLETYLSDTFCNKVLHSDELIEKVIVTNPELNNKKYSISEIFDWKKNITNNISEYLFSIMWHNIAKVEKMYNNVLDVSFPKDIKDLYLAINIRHDIVHRNGRTKTGKIRKINKKSVSILIINIREFADHINEQLNNIEAEQNA